MIEMKIEAKSRDHLKSEYDLANVDPETELSESPSAHALHV